VSEDNKQVREVTSDEENSDEENCVSTKFSGWEGDSVPADFIDDAMKSSEHSGDRVPLSNLTFI